ncbi:MAG: type II toxin-antitoxin system RelE/ParE family toxin [Nitrospiraceae bacterium]|nr:type II toxin-antitoxin system RelE/ParE family toxin [Nitrospiraceae bacterium]
MPWFRLAFRPDVATDLAAVDIPTAQRLFDKTKWLASNVDNLRHETVAPDLPGICKYAVGDWRIFYSIDRADQVVDIHHIAQAKQTH